MYNVGVYLKKRYPENGSPEKQEWERKMEHYNKKYMKPPCDSPEMVTTIASVKNKDYHYKCKDEPIFSFCNA